MWGGERRLEELGVPEAKKGERLVLVVGGRGGMVYRAKSSMEIQQLKLKKHHWFWN